MKRAWILATLACYVFVVHATARAEIIAFKDDFQSDTAGQTGAVDDLDPVIGVGDIGGTWTVRESTTLHTQVINDTVPGDATAGGNNYLQMIRGGSSSSTSKVYATGWDTATTFEQVVQLDFSMWQQPAGVLSVWFLNQAPPGGTGFPNFANGSALPDLDDEVGDEAWHTVRITANLSSSTPQMGIPAQTYDLSIDGGIPTNFAFNAANNFVQTVGFFTGANDKVEYIDDLQFKILADPPTSFAWNSDAAGDWNTASNWIPGFVPNANNYTATLGAAITAPRTVFSDQSITLKSLTFDNANSYIVAGAGTLTLEADAGNAAIGVNQGLHQFQLNVALASTTNVDVADGATLEFNNRLNLGGQTLTKLGGGALKINNDLNTGGGSIVVMGGSVGGGGSIAGDLANNGGTVGPGNSPGTLTVQGAYMQSSGGTLAIEIAGLTAGTQYDRLVVDGAATLSGALAVSLMGGFMPSLGDSFEVLTFASHGGEFSNYTGLALGGHLALKPVYSATNLLLNARPAIDGDVNLDGAVDIFDVNVVSFNWATAGPQGDADGDGVVDIFDVNVISLNWGATGGGSATAVPEPASLALVLGGMAAMIVYRPRRARWIRR